MLKQAGLFGSAVAASAAVGTTAHAHVGANGLQFFGPKTIRFRRTKGRVQKEKLVIPVAGTPRMAVAVISGFEAQFSREDRNFGELDVRLASCICQPGQIVVCAELGLKDHSGYYDDEFGGSIEVVVFCL